MSPRKIIAVLIVSCVALAVGFAGSLTAASATDFPSRTIRIIVPFGAGGATDLMARALAPHMSSNLGGVEIIVENRPGGGGAIAAMEMLLSPPDGYTIMLSSGNDMLLTPNISDVGYTIADYAPIARVSTLPTTIFVRTESEVETLGDLVRLAEENFGRLSFATTGAGSGHHVVAEAFQLALGKPGLFTHVPFSSGPESIAAVLGGHVDFVFGNASYGESYVRSQGVLRGLATTASVSCPILPELPSLRSLGYDVTFYSVWGFTARAGTPAEILNALDEAARKALESPEIAQIFENIGLIVDYLGRTEFTIDMLDEYYRMGNLLREIGLAH